MKRPNSILVSAVFALIVLCMNAPQFLAAQEATKGTNSRKARDQATKSIPYQNLTEEAKNLIGPVVQRPSIYRRLPINTIDIDPDYYLFLVRHPEVVINIWQLMGVTEMTADRIAPFTLQTDDGAGTLGQLELIYGTNNLHIFYGEGEYSGSVLTRNLKGKIVIVMKTDYQLDAAGKPTTTSQMDIFVKIDNATLSLIAKTLHPIIGTTADHNFSESINFLQRLNETTMENGPGVQGMVHRLDSVTPEVRREFVRVAGLVFDRAEAGVQYTTRTNAQLNHRNGQLQSNSYAQNNGSNSNKPNWNQSSLNQPFPIRQRDQFQGSQNQPKYREAAYQPSGNAVYQNLGDQQRSGRQNQMTFQNNQNPQPLQTRKNPFFQR